MILYFLLGGLCYVAGATLSYLPTLKVSVLYMPIAIFIGALAHYLWFTIAKSSNDQNQIYVYAIIWDSMFMVIYSVLPVMAFDVRLTGVQVCGVVLVLIGMILTKI